MVAALNFYIIALLLFVTHSAAISGLLSAFVVFHLNRKGEREATYRSKLYALLSIPPLIVAAAFILLPVVAKFALGRTLFDAWWLDALIFVFCAVVGVAAGFYMLRQGVQKLDKIKQKMTVTSEQERNRKTDVRYIDEFLPDPMAAYDTEKYIDFSKGTFLGLGEDKNPIYWPAGKTLPHVEVAGTTGSGKGIFIGMLISQNIGQGEAVFVVDPKNDEWLPHVVATAAKKYGKQYHYINLRPSAPPQLNLFAGANVEEIEELFLAGFGLAETGKSSDFYSIADREAAAFLAKEAVKPGATPATLCADFYDIIKKEMKAEKFAGYLREMAAIPSVNAAAGIDLRKIVAEGGAVYVVGSMRNAKVMRLQKMLVIKLIQLAEERDRTGDAKLRPVSCVLDEFIYHISKPTLEGLGAARDKGMHITLAHQALADFARCGADLDKEAVMGAVMENCKLKLVYKIEDPDTAEWLARKSGKILVDDETRTVEKNLALSETVDDKRTIRQAERYYMDDNMIMNLHERLGIVFGLGLPKFSFSSPVKAVKASANLVCKEVTSTAAKDIAPANATAAPEKPGVGADIFGAVSTTEDPLAPLPATEPAAETAAFEDVETQQSEF